jgi:hypothetical protein
MWPRIVVLEKIAGPPFSVAALLNESADLGQ